MIKCISIATLVLFASCGQTNVDHKEPIKADSLVQRNNNSPPEPITLSDKGEKFLWRESRYDKKLKDTFTAIVINETLCKTVTEPERAALGFVATFVGNECNWDGEAKDDFSNLKCKILSSLDLGYQCSDKHLGFLRRWFKNDNKSLKQLENCPTVPYTASSQTTFDYINLNVNGNEIAIAFGANGVNMQMGESWSWTETDHFVFDKDNIRLNKKDESKVKREHFETNK
jgi:hypothetical protein